MAQTQPVLSLGRPVSAMDIERLIEAELINLNRRIGERLRLSQHMCAHKDMLAFRIGGRVMVQPDGRGLVQGMPVRHDRKFVTVVTDDGHRWTVSPSLLPGAAAPDEARSPTPPSPTLLK